MGQIYIFAIMEIEFDCNSWIDISKENAKLVIFMRFQIKVNFKVYSLF